jgi:hypothetical protein
LYNDNICKLYGNIIVTLKLGTDPRLIMDQDIIAAEMHPINKIRLDTIFKIYGYECEWEKINF